MDASLLVDWHSYFVFWLFEGMTFGFLRSEASQEDECRDCSQSESIYTFEKYSFVL